MKVFLFSFFSYITCNCVQSFAPKTCTHVLRVVGIILLNYQLTVLIEARLLQPIA